MEQEIYTIKKKLEEIISEKAFLNFSKKFGNRRESQFRIGKLSFKEKTTIFENDEYVVFGDNLSELEINAIIAIIKNSSL